MRFSISSAALFIVFASSSAAAFDYESHPIARRVVHDGTCVKTGPGHNLHSQYPHGFCQFTLNPPVAVKPCNPEAPCSTDHHVCHWNPANAEAICS